MKPTITVNQYPIGWEWLDRVPLEDFTWLIEIFSTMTDNTDTYDFATFDKEAYLTKKFIYRMNLIIILLVYAFIQVYLIE